MIEAPTADEHDEIVDLIVDQQGDVARRLAAVGLERDGIVGELAAFDPPWWATARVRRAGGAVLGACGVEWDDEVGRAWIVGPWVRVDDEGWVPEARALVDAVLAELPPGVDRVELAGEPAHLGLARLAQDLGWAATEVNHVLVADAAVVGSWPDAVGDAVDARLRSAVPGDAAAIAPLHDDEFPGTYATARRLVDEAVAGERITLVAPAGDGALQGYASGTVHGDGEGFIDFVAVDPSARGGGVGAALVRALTRQLLDRSPLGQVGLTVQDRRAPARAVYARLGFRHEAAIVGYRSWI